MSISKSAHISIDWSIEVEDVDISVTTAVIVLRQAVLIKAVFVKSQIISHREAIASTDWILDQRRFADVFTLLCGDALAKFHVENFVLFMTVMVNIRMWFVIVVVIHQIAGEIAVEFSELSEIEQVVIVSIVIYVDLVDTHRTALNFVPEDRELVLGQLTNVLNGGCVTVLEFDHCDILAFIITTATIVATIVATSAVVPFIKASTVAFIELVKRQVFIEVRVTVCEECRTDLVCFIIVNVESDELYET